jgi:signal transduction histidine kinase
MTAPSDRRSEGRSRSRDAAPVDYAPIRPAYQAVRAGLAAALIALTGAGLAAGVPGSLFEMALLALVLVDALIRIRRRGSILPSLLVDLVIGGLTVGAGTDVEAAMVAFVAYLLTASVLLLSPRRVVLLLAAAPIVVGIRMTWLATEQSAELSAALARGELTVFLVAMTLILLASVELIHRARAQQAASLAAERRASELKNEFVSMVSHELRTPLTNVAGFALTVQETWRNLDPDEVDEFLRIICSEADHLRKIVDDVLAIPRLEAGRLLLDPTVFQLHPAAYRIAELIFPPGGDREAAVSVPGGVYVDADPNRVEQVLRNLLENARKYGGDQVTIEAERRGAMWQIIVADNGAGVPEEDRERIFEGFEQLAQGDTRSSNGLGLGLFITRRLVEAMGGEIWYEPGFPVGARFCFTLPAVEPPRRRDVEGSPSAAATA